MKEFDKIYIAKYKDILTIGQIAEDMRTTQKNISKILEELKETGLDTIYKNIPDEEWEKLENKTDIYILKKYLPLSKKNNDKAFKEILETFKKIENKKVQFEIFDNFKWELKGIKDKIIVDEEWKQIKDFHYSLSNYGRVRNDKTKQIKNPRFHRWILQVDIYENGKRYTVNIKRLVAELFIREVMKNEKVISKDGDIRNNYYKNLEIVSK